MTSQEQKKRESELAEKVLSLSVGRLLLKQHYFSSAVGRLSLRQHDGLVFTDGSVLCYDPEYILERYKQSDALPVHDLLHMLMHNIFRHWNVGSVEPKLWDAACDIAAEALISSLDESLVPKKDAQRRAQVIRSLSSEVRPLTAEKLYNYLYKSKISQEQADEYLQLFSIDDHSLWHNQKKDQDKQPEEEEKLDTVPVSADEDSSQKNEGSSKNSDGEQDGNDKKESDDGRQDNGSQHSSDEDNADSIALEQWLEHQRGSQAAELEQQWQQIAKQIQSELESYGKNDSTIQLVEVLEHVCRDKTDYTAFLRRFAVSGEVMRSDLDSFDVNFYCYGMQLYGDVAFIEPPEYKEVRRVKDFVIAIDTSESVSRKAVHDFVCKTYSILSSEESFFSRVNIHILQCDTRIQDCAVINCEQELEEYIRKLELHGFGGTDFRPVFEYVDELRAQGSLTDLKGLIYFTDGMGAFPEKAPEYEAAFVFISGDYEKNGKPEVPPWATKILLEQGDVTDV